MNEHEQLDERYLEAQLREELGIHPDLSEDVLQRVYAQPPRRLIPPPRRKSVWKPLVAAASVLLVAGAAAFALVKVLPDSLGPKQPEQRRSVKQVDEGTAAPRSPEHDPAAPPEPADSLPQDQPDDQPDDQLETPAPQETEHGTGKQPDKGIVIELPPADDKHDGTPKGEVEVPPPRRTHTDPHPMPPDHSLPKERAVLAASWQGESIRVTNKRGETRLEHGEEYQARAGDRVRVKGFADFTLLDGSLLRVDGEFTFEGEAGAVEVILHDGALYTDTLAPLAVSGDGVSAVVDGVAAIEERLRALDVYCVQGRVSAGEEVLSAGSQSRLEHDGFGREKPVSWGDVQREFRFLKDTPVRAVLREDLDEAPGVLFGGAIKDGVLRGETDSNTGLGFYLREPYTMRAGDVVRFRFRVEKACEMILQFGTVNDANWRHKMGGVKAGEWIEYELPLQELYKTTDVARKAEPGLSLKFFQLHPEDGGAAIQLDRVEIIHRP
ncbi:MAG: hypothetical protein K8I27_17360 [Planctomycetes bacterium]|nr:hypothetical protein [Planctomycetota bacterium]